VEGSVFISYRRDDTSNEARRLYDSLVAEFGTERVFKDIDNIPLGHDFRAAITTSIGQADLMLVVIGPNFVPAERGDTSRLDDSNDFVRIEIEHAFTARIDVILVLVNGARMPPAERLPQSIQALTDMNALSLGNDTWTGDLRPLVEAVVGSRPDATPHVKAGGRARLDESGWRSLVHSVENGDCTLMLGPSAVTGVVDGELLPVQVAMARYVKEQLGSDGEHLDSSNPSSVADFAVAYEDLFTLQSWVVEFYEGVEGNDSVLSDLAALPFKLVVDTAPDLAAHRAFLAEKPQTYGGFYDRHGPASHASPDTTVDTPLIYHLFGSLEMPSSLVLTSRDHTDHLTGIISKQPGIPIKLRSMLSDPSRTILLIGWTLDNLEEHKQLMAFLLGDATRRVTRSVAAVDRVTPEAMDYFRTEFNLRLVAGGTTSFVRELCGRVSATRSGGSRPG
jgi:hypothetical protein